jgi:Na+/H+-dicarboxylate symporter
MFPANLTAAAVEFNILGLIVFSLMFGGAVSALGERGKPLVQLFDIANEALLGLVQLVVWLAPLGILGLVADRLGKAGGGAAVWLELKRLAWYAATVILGLTIHSLVTLPAILKVFARRNIREFAAGMLDALLTAFGTASSAATMGVTLRCLIDRLGVSRRAADFVIPVGTTVNMNGTALYEAVAALFAAQSLGLHLGLGQQIVVLLTATLAAVGAAAIPEAGLVTLILVMTAVGLPPEAVGMIVSIDWILDRFRTTVNVWGDAVVAAAVDRHIPEQPPQQS